MTKDGILTALAPAHEPLDPAWSQATLAGILSTGRPAPIRRRRRRTALVALAAACVSLSTAAAVGVGGPQDAIEHLLTGFIQEPNTTGNGLGELDDPELVAQFVTPAGGVFAIWVATPVSGTGVCYAMADGTWDGQGTPTKDQLDYGCGGEVWAGPGKPPEELARPEQLSGFFKDSDGPLIYGISPYADAVAVRVEGPGVDRTLPVRADSHGYGDALPEAGGAAAVRLTFVDASGRELGSTRFVAPVG